MDQIIGTRSSTDFGMNFGAGVSFRVGETASVYFQVKWAYIWGPTFDAAGDREHARSEPRVQCTGISVHLRREVVIVKGGQAIHKRVCSPSEQHKCRSEVKFAGRKS